jgi:hypothetical protein
MLRFKYQGADKKNGKLDIDTRIAKVDAPAIDDAQFNKYGIPSYYQMTFFPQYSFDKVLKGLDMGFLYVWRLPGEEMELTPTQRYYQTDMHNLNLVMNINF